jgi:SNF family Na+-dependent transporter
MYILNHNVSTLGAATPKENHKSQSLYASGLRMMISQLYCYLFYALTIGWVIQQRCFNCTGYLVSNEIGRWL